jgi:hypothetical protein
MKQIIDKSRDDVLVNVLLKGEACLDEAKISAPDMLEFF